MERPLTLIRLKTGKFYDMDSNITPIPTFEIKVTKIEYSPTAFGFYPVGTFPNRFFLTPQQQVEIIKGCLDPVCVADDFCIEEDPMLQAKGILFRVTFNDGTVYVYHDGVRWSVLKNNTKKKKIKKINKQPIWLCAYFFEDKMYLKAFSSKSKALFYVNFLCIQKYKIVEAHIDEGITQLYKAFNLDIDELQTLVSQNEGTKLN